jgi:hypothetical protein
MGWPIVGDRIYGSAPRSGGPDLHLHAREIVVPLYKNREPIRVSAPVPPAHAGAALRLRLDRRGVHADLSERSRAAKRRRSIQRGL